ncbi:glycosyltransferase [Halomonas sp. KRD171]|uniref:glycosyltransferase n=1 Tax=Halomonas sp. KRD171 TaxID=2729726 RepID=UPI0019D300D7|nr:glycosyltransferase [Halomonas sp. KRD171]
MNIFIFCGPLAFGKGGMEKVAAGLANFLSKNNNVTVGFFCRENQVVPAYQLDKRVIQAPWSFREVGSRRAYSKRVFDSNPHVFIYFGASSQSIQVVSLLYGSDIPLIIHEGSNPDRVITTNWADVRKISRYEAAWERELVYSQAAAVRFTMPEYLKSLSGSSLKSKAFAFPNAFNSLTKENKRSKFNRIINIGGLKPNKNIKPLIIAFSHVVEKYPEWELHVFSTRNKSPAGEFYISELESLINSLCLKKNVFFREEVEDINAEFINSDIHVITSLSEGLSNAVAEAMTNGVPTVGIENVPGVSGLIKNKVNGFLVSRKNLELSLIEALFTLVSDDRLRSKLSDQARKDSNVFNPDKIYNNWLELIDFSVAKKNNKYDESEFHYSHMAKVFYCSEVKGFEDQVDSQSYHQSIKKILNTDCDLNKVEKHAKIHRWLNE